MARSNLQIAEGSFVGNATDNTNISAVGFRPQVVIAKNGANNSVIRTDTMRGDTSGFLTSTNANLSDRVQTFLDNGFQVGTAAQVNANAANVYWIAIKGVSAQQYFRTLRYYGDGNDNRNITGFGLGFTPDFVLVRGDAAVNSCFRTSAMAGDSSSRFDANAQAADFIQNLQSNGFQVGTGTPANGSGTEYHGFAMKSLAGVLQVGSFTGDGTASKPITGVGFKPDVVIVKSNAAQQARLLTKSMVTNADTSLFMGTTATDATGILSLDTNGFTVGSGASVNGNGVTSYWIALKTGSFNVPLSRSAI